MVDEMLPIPVVYGDVGESLVFVEKEAAHDFVRLHEALEAETWGEFKAKAPSHWYEDAVERLKERMLDEASEDDQSGLPEEPTAEKRFDADEIPGHADSDWPDWPAGSMASWLPGDIQRNFGTMQSNFPFGDFLTLSPEHEDQIVSAMRDHGYACVRDDDLAWRASFEG